MKYYLRRLSRDDTLDMREFPEILLTITQAAAYRYIRKNELGIEEYVNFPREDDSEVECLLSSETRMSPSA